jgi:hypothetical protein
MDNLAAHKIAGVHALIEACGAQLLYLPPYSLARLQSHRGKLWSKVKELLRAPKPACWKPSKLPSPRLSPQSLPITPSLGFATAATGYTNYETL